jgi:hypothetical protein
MSDSLYTIKEPYARYSLTDEAYEKIRVYLPEDKATGRPGMDVRFFLDALILSCVRDAAGEVSLRHTENGTPFTRNLGHGNPKKFFREYICA